MAQAPSGIGDSAPESPSGRRLESWKEIAGYLRRDVATARRWEKRGALPVHRHQHGKQGSVYAYTAELDAWSTGRSRPAEPGTPPVSTPRRHALKAALGAVVLAAVVSAFVWRMASDTAPVASLAVLPFQALGESTLDETLELGMADALITRLGSSSRIRVPPLSAGARVPAAARVVL